MDLSITKVFDCMTDEMSNKIINMLVSENGFSPTDAEKRIKEILFVVLDENENIAGSCSGIPYFVKELNGWFLYYRSYTSKNYRDIGISYNLINAARSYFNDNRVFKDIELQGVYAIFENAYLNQLKNYIIPRSGLTLIGFTKEGYQIRVRYFEDAKLPA